MKKTMKKLLYLVLATALPCTCLAQSGPNVSWWTQGSGLPTLACSSTVNNGVFYTGNVGGYVHYYQCSNVLGYYNWNDFNVTGAVEAGSIEGFLYADQWQTPSGTGNNGIATALVDCSATNSVCDVIAPPIYSQTEAQPWGGANTSAAGLYGLQINQGPKITDPSACVVDWRYGVPQTMCNLKTSNPLSGRFNVFPSYTSESYGFSNVNTPANDTLGIFSHYYGPGRDSYIDEAYQVPLDIITQSYSRGVRQQIDGRMKCYATGDCINLFMDAYSTGNIAAQNEGVYSLRSRSGETANVVWATLNSMTCYASPTCTLGLSQTQGIANTFADMLPLIDLTTAYSTGYIASIVAGTVTLSSDAVLTGYGATTATTTTTTAIAPTGDGHNIYPIANAVLHVSSSAGFVASSTPVCLFSAAYNDNSWFCAHITAIGSGTITLDVAQVPMLPGATVAQGGLTGYGFSADADGYDPANDNGMTNSTDEMPTVKIRQVFPIISNTGQTVTLMTANGPNGHWNTRAYSAMGGSGGTCSVTVTSGAVTSVSVSGGTGYIDPNRPPQLVISGITSTTVPVVYVTGIWVGALTTAAISSAGSGIMGTPSCTVSTYNPYHIFPQTLTLNTFNQTTGKNDGSVTLTTPILGTFNTSDTLELAHWFNIKSSGALVSASTLYQQSISKQGILESVMGGQFGENDYAAYIVNTNNPELYTGYPGASLTLPRRNTYGMGQWYTPDGITMQGVFASGLHLGMPVFKAGTFHIAGALVVDCYEKYSNTRDCTKWTGSYPVLGVANGNASSDSLSYSPATSMWTLTAGAIGFSGSGANTSLTLDPVYGLNYSGPPQTIFTAGGLFSGTQTQYIANSANLLGSGWSNSGGAGFSITTSTPYSLLNAPAYRITTSVSADFANGSSPGVAANTLYTVSLWVKCISSHCPVLGLNAANGYPAVGFTPTNQWACYSFQVTTATSPLTTVWNLTINGPGTFDISSPATQAGYAPCGPGLVTSGTVVTTPVYSTVGQRAVFSNLAATSAAPTVASGVGYGGTVVASSYCGSLSGAAGCVVVNVNGRTAYVPYW